MFVACACTCDAGHHWEVEERGGETVVTAGMTGTAVPRGPILTPVAAWAVPLPIFALTVPTVSTACLMIVETGAWPINLLTS